MRSTFHVLLGAVAGFALGILAPIACALFLSWIDPEFRKGGATPFALLIIVTAPGGAIAGALWGYNQANPIGALGRRKPEQVLADFEAQFGHYSAEDQRRALAQMLPTWIDDYRAVMQRNWRVVAALVAGSLLLPFIVILVVFRLLAMRENVMQMRRALDTIRSRWGDAVVESAGELPSSLR